MENITSQLNLEKLPEHLAIIMDGNGRWAKGKNMPRSYGHKKGVESVKEIVESCAEIGIKHLTLYVFSTENWNRPKLEVSTLMSLMKNIFKKELDNLIKNNIQLNIVGSRERLSKEIQELLDKSEESTSANSGLILTLALNYGGREEIVNTVKNISKKVVNNELEIEKITQNTINNHLYTFSLPNVDFLIRTSGEKRISNFLLWQLAYAELYFTDTFWPDFNKEHLYKALIEYQNRERRFGTIEKKEIIHEKP